MEKANKMKLSDAQKLLIKFMRIPAIMYTDFYMNICFEGTERKFKTETMNNLERDGLAFWANDVGRYILTKLGKEIEL